MPAYGLATKASAITQNAIACVVLSSLGGFFVGEVFCAPEAISPLNIIFCYLLWGGFVYSYFTLIDYFLLLIMGEWDVQHFLSIIGV